MLQLDPAVPSHVVIDDLLSPEDCAELRAHAAELDFQLASVGYPSGARVATDVRNNARAIEQDPALAERLFHLLRPYLPERVHGRTLVGLSARIRYYRYRPGERFAPHRDGVELGPDGSSSLLTVLVYIGAPQAGGETRLLREGISVPARLGSALVFQHALLHEGAAVTEGEKLVLRTDALYQA